jgi:hypothetical protein
MQKLWPIKVCYKKLTRTIQTAQFGLNSDWTSREHCQHDLDADLTFLEKKIKIFSQFFLTSDRNLTHGLWQQHE